MKKWDLEELYQKHHEKGDRYGYLYCHGARAPFLKNWIGQGKTVLDLGCRDGMLTQSFAQGNRVVGVDIDRNALQLCKERLKIETVWLDLNTEWIWPEHSVDCIVACEILEHLFFADSFLEKVWQTLKPNGLFIGSVPNAFRWRNRWKFLWGKEYETDPTHVRQFSFEKLNQLLQKRFRDIEIVPLEGKICPFLTVQGKTPRAFGKRFSKDLLWCCRPDFTLIDEMDVSIPDERVLVGRL